MKKYEKFKIAQENVIPEIYDRIGKTIQFGFEKQTRKNEQGDKETFYQGYNIPLSGHIDYGHIKSQIIRHVYADKDVDAILNNAVSELIKERAGGKANEVHIDEFLELEEWRAIAANAAKDLVERFK